MAIKLERFIGNAPTTRDGLRMKLDYPAVRTWIARTANEELAEVQKDYGFPKDRKDYVARVQRRIVDKVTPRNARIGKTITYSAVGEGGFTEASINLIKLIMRKVPFAPKTASAKRSGQRWRGEHYRDAFQMKDETTGAVVVPPGPKFERRAIRWLESNADRIQAAGGTISVANVQPYALRLENGWSMQTPSGILKRALKTAQSSRKTRALQLDRYLSYEPAPKSMAGVTRMFFDKRRRKTRAAVMPVLRWGPAT